MVLTSIFANFGISEQIRKIGISELGGENLVVRIPSLALAGKISLPNPKIGDPPAQKLKNQKFRLPLSEAPFQMTWIIII